MVELPQGFKEMLRETLGDEAQALIDSLDKPPVTSVRLNKRKPGAIFENSSPVAWCESGLYLDSRPEFIFDPLLHAGAYYVQDASSMIYETVAGYLISEFSKKSDSDKALFLNVLDLCAAPGGKTTALINALPDGCEVTANEYSHKRVSALRENIDRWGYQNVTITNKDSSYYASLEEYFDIVAVDAPCSGEGMMRKEEMARKQWSLQLVNQCASLQKDILRNAVEALKPGGFLIYSTCTFNRMENEDNAEYIEDKLGLKALDLNFPEAWGIPRGLSTNLPCYRFMPHKTKGEGLFLSVFQKPGIWKPSKKTLSRESVASPLPHVDVDKSTALRYLRGESIVLAPVAPRGPVVITFKGLPLGEAKNIGTRANNLYPKSRRILKR